MGYTGQRSRGIAVRRLHSLLTSDDATSLREIAKHLRELAESFDKPEHIIQVSTDTSDTDPLIVIAVDGGENLICPQAREVAIGLIRVGAFSPDAEKLSQPLPNPFEVCIKGFRLLSPDRKHDRDHVKTYLESLLESHETLKKFLKLTGITLADLGTYYQRDITSLVTTIRDIAEWSFLVHLADQYKETNVLIVKDGRLAQVGVKKEFRNKLLQFFQSNRTRLVGVVKASKLMGDQLAVRLLLRWLDCHPVPIAIRVPDALMEYVYTTSRQWHPEEGKSLVLGRRYLLRFRKKEFIPLESAIAFDVPSYLEKDKRTLQQVITTLYKHRSALYGGSVAPIVRAHDTASVADASIRHLERELWELVEREVFGHG